MNFKFKKENPDASKRRTESIIVRKEYPDRIPVVCEKGPYSTLKNIHTTKYLIVKRMTISQVIITIREQLGMDKDDSNLFLLVSGKDPINFNADTSMGEIYEQHKDPEDEILYLSYIESDFEDSSFATSFNCPQCSSALKNCWMSESEIMLTCENKFCLFPLDSENMSLFIIHKNKIKESKEKIAAFLSSKKEDAQNSTSTSNYSYLENNIGSKFYPYVMSESPVQMNNVEISMGDANIYEKEINLFTAGGSNNEEFYTLGSYR